MNTLHELWQRNGNKPFKAVKVLEASASAHSKANVSLKVGTKVHIIEKNADGNLEGAILHDSGKEDRSSFVSAGERIWKQV